MIRRLLSWSQMPEFLISVFLYSFIQIHVTTFFMRDFCFCLMKTSLCQHQLDQRLQYRFYFLANSRENAFMHPCTSYFQSALEAELDTTNTTSPLPSLHIGKRRKVSRNERLFGQIFKLNPVLLRLRHWQ